jgi:hypothetical protein
MEGKEQQQGISRRRRSGQTLVEFALTLPILLVLLFGIIEFGRIFQAWVTLQNAARAAARYATTGQYNVTLYPLVTNGSDDPNSVVPCMRSASAAERGVRGVLEPNGAGGTQIQVYERGGESLYATWYTGEDCNTESEEDQNRRKDMVRLLSIIQEARRGAAGLALVPPPYVTTPVPGNAAAYNNFRTDGTGLTYRQIPWFIIWDRPLPSGSVQNAQLAGSNTPGWFDVMICSNRPKIDPTNRSAFLTSALQPDPLRFRTVLDASQGPTPELGALAPACLMNEVPNQANVMLGWNDAAGRPWLDAGGPGDVVNIVVTFNHPLITPLGFAQYLPLQARRAAVNESFRTSRAANLGQSIPQNPGQILQEGTPPPDPNTPTNTATSTNTVPPNSTATNTPTSTVTPTPIQAFDCTRLSLAFGSIGSNSVSFVVSNDNAQQTTLVGANLQWRILAPPAGVSAVQTSRVDGGVVWTGFDTTPSTSIGVGGSDGAISGSPVIRNNTGGSTLISFEFQTAQNLAGVYQTSFLSGTTLTIDDPNSATNCTLTYTDTSPTATATATVAGTPTNTAIPACIPGLIFISFGGFNNTGGVVQWNIINGRNVSASLIGFNLAWNARASGYSINGVYVGAPPGVAGSQPIWRSSGAGQDNTPPTIGYQNGVNGLPAREGTWQNTVSMAAGTSLTLYVDFEGTGGSLAGSSLGSDAQLRSDFAPSRFYFSSPACPGDPGSGVAGFENVPVTIPTPPPTQTPTNTSVPPTATNTRPPQSPTATFTVTNTRPPATATNTRPPATPTNTRPPATATFTRTPTPVGGFDAGGGQG